VADGKRAKRRPSKRAARKEIAEAADAIAHAEEESAEAAEAHAAAHEEVDEAREAVEAAPDDPLLDTAIRQIEAQVDEEHPFGVPGRPLDRRSPFRIAFTAALGVAAAYVLAQAVLLARQVLILLVVAAFLAIGLNPLVELLTRHRFSRRMAVVTISFGFVAFLGGFAAAIVPPIANQATQLTEKLPDYVQRLEKDNGQLGDLIRKYKVREKVTDAVQNGGGLKVFGGVIGIGKAVLSALFSFFTVLILTLYLLSNYPRIKQGAYRLVPRSRRPRVGLLSDEILSRVGGYVLGNLLTSLVIFVVTLIFLAAVGVPYPVAIAMFVGLMDLVPLVGATIGGAVTVAIAFFTSVPVGIITAVFYVLYQQFENYVLVPRVMKRTVDVSPLATILAALIGGTLLGIVGALLAIPVAAAIQLIGSEVWIPKQDTA
jgi:predicted PurR-regulated permease PerM